ncbi:MAG: HAD family hydrolase [Pseudomonadota bacterium]
MATKNHTGLKTIGFDADDTLWHNERFYRLTQERFASLLADYAEPDHLDDRLFEAEKANIGRYGYGIKGFTLSMIETAIDVTDGKVPASVIRELIAAGQDMLAHPIELLPHVGETVRALSSDFTLVLITKGDLLDQERKLAQSGLGDFFHGVEIVSEKTPDTYVHAFGRHGTGAESALMIGNSMRSDVVPALEAGAWAAHVPHELAWALEHAETPSAHPRFRKVNDLGEIPRLVASLE